MPERSEYNSAVKKELARMTKTQRNTLAGEFRKDRYRRLRDNDGNVTGKYRRICTKYSYAKFLADLIDSI